MRLNGAGAEIAARPAATAIPACRADAVASASKRLFPTPPSPTMSTQAVSPARAPLMARARMSFSASRPTRTVAERTPAPDCMRFPPVDYDPWFHGYDLVRNQVIMPGAYALGGRDGVKGVPNAVRGCYDGHRPVDG